MQRPDFQQTFIRLAVASRGVYQQHVILNDYAVIPGVSQHLFDDKVLDDKSIAASAFEVNDKDLDLSPDKAQTFTGSARLVKL